MATRSLPMQPAPASDAIPLRELRDLAAAPMAADASPLSGHPCLLVTLDPAADLAAAECQSIARWLGRQSCPTIAIGGTGAPAALAAAFDVVVADAAAAAPLLHNIRRTPLAAMVLVQVLRVSENLPVEAALVVESLGFAALQDGPEFRAWLEQQVPRAERAPRDPGPPVLVERDGGRVEIRLNRPSERNALSVEMRDALCEALELVVADPSIRSARLAGNGECFSAGGHLHEFGSAPDPATAHAVRSVRLPAAVLVRCAERTEFFLHGSCVGSGIELPAFSRRIVAHRDAWFQLPELNYGLIPGAGGCVGIPRRIGRQRAAWLALSGERLAAGQALAWGLVDAVSA